MLDFSKYIYFNYPQIKMKHSGNITDSNISLTKGMSVYVPTNAYYFGDFYYSYFMQ